MGRLLLCLTIEILCPPLRYQAEGLSGCGARLAFSHFSAGRAPISRMSGSEKGDEKMASKANPATAPQSTAEFRARKVLDHYERRLSQLETDYARSRKTFADELTDGEGPTWISSSSEGEWRRLRTEMWQLRDVVKSLRYIADGGS